jgi:DMSO/TMAO reductase YedYZ heme-binding membrane subunit
MKKETLKSHFIYWLLPSVVTLACILLFYLNPLGLSSVIAPEINREFGIAENIQLLLLVLIFIYSIKGIRQRATKIEKYGYLLLAVATAFIFLEEIDYGLHYYDHLTGNKTLGTQVVIFDREVRNIHNQDKVILDSFKMVSYVLIVLFFVLLPLLPATLKQRFPLLNYFSPSRLIITTAFSLLVLNQVALYLYNNYNYSNPSLNANVSEFEEIMTYYIIFLYIREMTRKPKEVTIFKKPALAIADNRMM